MRRTIWKYDLDTQDEVVLDIPKGAEILTVQMQFGKPCMWVMVDPKADKEHRVFEIVGTGNPMEINEERQYVATYQLMQGALVFHVFELTA